MQGPWADWPEVMKSPEWQESVNAHKDGFQVLMPVIKVKQPEAGLMTDGLNQAQKINLLETVCNLNAAKNNDLVG